MVLAVNFGTLPGFVERIYVYLILWYLTVPEIEPVYIANIIYFFWRDSLYNNVSS